MAKTRLTAEQLRALRYLALRAGGAAPPAGRTPTRMATWRSLAHRGLIAPTRGTFILTAAGYQALSQDGYQADAQALVGNRFCS